MSKKYDLIVLGAASAGMPAAIYAKRFGLNTLLMGAEIGGLLNESPRVENWPGDISVPGRELMERFKAHVKSLGVEIKETWIEKIEQTKEGYNITAGKETYETKAIIYTLGSKHRHLGVPGEEEFSSKGVSYCPTCDAAFFKDVPVAVIGGGDGAASAALLLAEHASKVYVLVRRNEMRAEPINRKRLEEHEKIEILYETKVVEFVGEKVLTGIKLSKALQGTDVLSVEGAFVMIGADPNTQMAEALGASLNDRREIIIDDESRTNLPFFYAAGDCANRKYKQAITGAAEGVIAAFSAFEDIRKSNLK